jgi:hypothetical protein
MSDLIDNYELLVKAEEERDEHGYWGEHPKHPVDDWKAEIASGDTRHGYWVWVAARMDEGGDDE